MAKWITCTEADGNYQVLVNLDRVIIIRRRPRATQLMFDALGQSIKVKETPEELFQRPAR